MDEKKCPKVFDEIDYQIIMALRRDARKSSSAVAKELGINERTARRRIDNLVESKALRFSAVCEPSAFGYNNILDVNVEIEDDYYGKTIEAFEICPSICYISKGWGQNGITIQCRFKSGDDINKFLHNYLTGFPGVKIVSYYFEAKILRDADSWEPAESDFARSLRITTEKE